MTEPVRERLERLRDATRADSLTEVIRNSLAVYEYLWNEHDCGNNVFVKMPDGTEREVVFLK